MSDKEILLEQYKAFVKTTDKVSSLRSTTNNFFIVINTALLAFFPVIFDKTSGIQEEGVFIIIVGVVGLVLNAIWFLTIKTYKTLNSAKFKAIKEMEDQLPAQPFEREWERLKSRKWTKKYLTLTGIEIFLPLVMVLPYIALLILHPSAEVAIEQKFSPASEVRTMDATSTLQRAQ